MIPSMRHCSRLAVMILLGSGTTLSAYAQQTPITGQMGAPTAPATTAQPPATPPPPAPPVSNTETTAAVTEVGSATRRLFAMQSQGTNAGGALPIPGEEASASYQRYLKSFDHPIPEFYETAMSKNGGGGSGGSGSSGTSGGP